MQKVGIFCRFGLVTTDTCHFYSFSLSERATYYPEGILSGRNSNNGRLQPTSTSAKPVGLDLSAEHLNTFSLITDGRSAV